jgi:hypothetical protein
LPKNIQNTHFAQETTQIFAKLCIYPWKGYSSDMSVNEVLERLPSMTLEERELIVQRVLELDERLSLEDEELIERRRAGHRADPGSAVPAAEMFTRLRDRFSR